MTALDKRPCKKFGWKTRAEANNEHLPAIKEASAVMSASTSTIPGHFVN